LILFCLYFRLEDVTFSYTSWGRSRLWGKNIMMYTIQFSLSFDILEKACCHIDLLNIMIYHINRNSNKELSIFKWENEQRPKKLNTVNYLLLNPIILINTAMYRKIGKSNPLQVKQNWWLVGFWCLTPLSAIFHGDQF
jgi:hypothetical protein